MSNLNNLSSDCIRAELDDAMRQWGLSRIEQEKRENFRRVCELWEKAFPGDDVWTLDLHDGRGANVLARPSILSG